MELIEKYSVVQKMIPDNCSGAIKRMLSYIDEGYKKNRDRQLIMDQKKILDLINNINQEAPIYLKFKDSLKQKDVNSCLESLKLMKYLLKKIQELYQKCGECVFYIYCMLRKLDVSEVKRKKGEKTPDFVIKNNQLSCFFEIKTIGVYKHDFQSILRICDLYSNNEDFLYLKCILRLSFENEINEKIKIIKLKNFNICKDVEINCNCFENKIKYEENIKEIVSHIMRKYDFIDFINSESMNARNASTMDKSNNEGDSSANINLLIEKVRNNYKKEQFDMGETFLVLNCMIPYELAWKTDYMRNFNSNGVFVSGIYWNSAFIKKGSVVRNCLFNQCENYLSNKLFNQDGILNQFPNISGLMIMNFDNNWDVELFYLYRSGEDNLFIKKELVDEEFGWNDSIGSNCIKLGSIGKNNLN